MSKFSGPHQFWEPFITDAGWDGFKNPHQFGGQNAWSLRIYKLGDDWATNFWATCKFDEQLCNGSEKALDWHYQNLTGKSPDPNSSMTLTLTLEPLDGFKTSTMLILLDEDENCPDAHFYSDTTSEIKWWLCPFWLDMWCGKQPPSECFAYLTA